MRRNRSCDGAREVINGGAEQSALVTWQQPLFARRGLARELIRETVCKILDETKSIKILSCFNGMKGPFMYS